MSTRAQGFISVVRLSRPRKNARLRVGRTVGNNPLEIDESLVGGPRNRHVTYEAFPIGVRFGPDSPWLIDWLRPEHSRPKGSTLGTEVWLAWLVVSLFVEMRRRKRVPSRRIHEPGAPSGKGSNGEREVTNALEPLRALLRLIGTSANPLRRSCMQADFPSSTWRRRTARILSEYFSQVRWRRLRRVHCMKETTPSCPFVSRIRPWSHRWRTALSG